MTTVTKEQALTKIREGRPWCGVAGCTEFECDRYAPEDLVRTAYPIDK